MTSLSAAKHVNNDFSQHLRLLKTNKNAPIVDLNLNGTTEQIAVDVGA